MTSSTADRLERLYPEMSEAERRRVAENVNERSPSSIWVPVTLRDVSVQSQPGSGNLYRTHVVMRYVNAGTYVPEKRQFTTPIRALNTPQSPFGQRCKDAGVRPSMGSVGDCYVGAMCESFFATLECELIEREMFFGRSEARLAVFDYVEGFYNSHRLHSALDYQSPVTYEKEYFREQPLPSERPSPVAV